MARLFVSLGMFDLLIVVFTLVSANGLLFLRIRRSGALCWRYAGGRRLLVDILLADAWAWSSLGMWYAPSGWIALQYYRISICVLAIIPLVWLAPFVLQEDRERFLGNPIVFLAGLIPLVTIVLIWTSTHNDWFIASAELVQVSGRASLAIEKGPWFWVHVIHTYVAAAVALAFSVTRSRPPADHKWVVAGVLVCGTVLLVASVLVVVISPRTNLPPWLIAVCVVSFSWLSYLFHMSQAGDSRRVAQEVLIAEFPDALFAVNSDGIVVDMNVHAEQVTQVRLAIALGRRAIEVFSRHKDLARALADTPFSESRLVSLFSGWFELRCLEQSDDLNGSTLYLLTDVTEREKARDEQRRLQAMLRGFLDQSSEAIAVLDERANVISWNASLAFLSGTSSERACGQPYGLIYADLVPRASGLSGPEHQRVLSMLRGEGERGVSVEHEIIGADGRRHFLQTDVVCFDTPLGRRIAHITMDITDIRAAQRHRDLLLEDLERASHELDRLRELLPVCAWCGKVRDDEGYWKGVEDYVSTQFGATVSRSMCPECRSAIEKAVRGCSAEYVRQALHDAGIEPRFQVSDSGLTDVLTSAGITLANGYPLKL